jgi:hypothetical protein
LTTDRKARSRRSIVTRFALSALLLLPASTLGANEGPDTPTPTTIRCVDVASDVGLDFRGDIGETVAEDEAAVIMQRNMGSGAAVGDYDRDGDLDVYLLGHEGHPNALFRNDADPGDGGRRFTQVALEAGVADTGLSRAAHFADLDGDGWLDLVLLNDADPEGRLPRSRLFRNEMDGTFTDVTEASGFDPVGYLVSGSSAVDVDADGDLDIYVAFWTRELGGSLPDEPVVGTLPGRNLLYRNDGDFRFTDITDRVGLGGISRDTFTPLFLDFDSDGDLDLFLPVDHREDLYFENDQGMFRDRSEAVGVRHVGNDMGIAVADVDGNGTFDLYITNITDPEENFGEKPRGNTLLLTDLIDGQLRFTDAAYEFGVRDTGWGWGTSFIDIDLDGLLDLFAVQGFDELVDVYSRPLRDATSVLFWNKGIGPLERVEGSGCDVPGDQRALVPFDYDRDGDVDLLITQVGLEVILLENRSTVGHWLNIRLDGPSGVGSGARVDVTIGERTISQLVIHGGSYLAGPPLEAIFGLGERSVADEVRVTDVRGNTVVLTDVAADRVVSIELP